MLRDCVGEEGEPESTIFAGPMVEMRLAERQTRSFAQDSCSSQKDSISTPDFGAPFFSSLSWILSVMCVYWV